MTTTTTTIDSIGIAACTSTLRASIAATYREIAAWYRQVGRHDDARTYELRAAAWEADTVRSLADVLLGVAP